MGAVISRWRVKPTTVDLLESLDKDIKDLEEFRTKNQRLLKLWVGRLLVYSSVLYLLSCVWVYLLYLPEQWIHRVAMSVPLLLFPGLVWCLWKLLIFLFSKRTERNNDKLEDLKVEKRKILEHVMETETYKNAKLILERFDPETRRKAELESTPVRPQMTPGPGQELRHRGGSGMRPPPMGTPITMTMTPAPATLGTPTGPAPLSAPGGPPERGLTAAEDSSGHQGVIRRLPQTLTYSPPIRAGAHPPGPPLSRPVLPRERSAVDRVIEYLVGDGPQNRYALICQQCFSHNGMALREEFEYLAFRCAYCYVLNPARKTRPQAPRLPEFNFERRLRSDSPSLRPAPLSGADTEEHPSEDEKEEGHVKEGETESQSEELQQPNERGKEEEPFQEVGEPFHYEEETEPFQEEPFHEEGGPFQEEEGPFHDKKEVDPFYEEAGPFQKEQLAESTPHHASSGVEEELQSVAQAQQSVAQEQQPVAQEQQPVAQEQQHVAQEQQHVAQEQQPVAQEQQPVAQEQQPVAQEQQPVAQEQQPVAQEQQPVAQEQA